MGQALYRKYRSKKFGEVVGQQHVTKTLTNALKSGKISHAYLFTGPRGVGKTSVARIFAHEVNNLKYDEDKPHLDIIEIDAASNRRIDEIRDLREKVHISPTSAKYKVYIIDEVHMLTKEAFNALLKTLEEPPAHVIFILATTEAHKLPETITSRTQRFTFKPINTIDAVTHLKSIAKAEGIKVNDEALELLAKHGEGSFRDSISLLDQVSGLSNEVKLEDVRTILGIAPTQVVTSIADATRSGNADQLFSALETAKLKGYQAAVLAKQLGEHYRTLLVNSEVDRHQAMELLKNLIGIPTSQDPDQLLELVLLEQLLSSTKKSTPVSDAEPDEKEEITPTSNEAPKTTVPNPGRISKSVSLKDDETWTKILDAVKKQHNTLYSTLRMANATFDDDQTLTLKFNFAFHKKRLEDPKILEILKTTANTVVGKPVTIISDVSNDVTPVNSTVKPTVDKKIADPALQAISNIFGDGEVLES